ncbi:molybdopterin binding domain protein [Methylobacterium nodulans ORS 2060]|uniref:Molybdopterin molybdenumtransferase n=2 Tax=Methylobacterium nodulans TaxID=114616 RepID=B8IL84_METNO|nr:molybdopterin binding domain protein [Methylobacterium nodulans ORS 2060]
MRLTAGLRPVAPETCPVGEAAGAVAASDLAAGRGMPRGRTALRDGWAVDAAAIVGATPYAPVSLAGLSPRVEAGEALPPGTDTVLPFEAVLDGEAVADAAAGEGTRPAGGELPEGSWLARAGERLSSLQLLALAAAGIGALAVRRPRIALVATGEASDLLSPLLAALVIGDAAQVAATRSVPDDPAAIAAALAEAEADAVFATGGTGFGASDRSAEGLARAGTVAAHGIALRPGETAGFGVAAGRPVLLLPGRPEAALAVYLALGRPLVAALAGRILPPAPAAPLLRKLSSVIGLSEIVFVRRSAEGVEPLGGADIPLHRLARADGAVLVPPEHEGYAKGTPVEILPL